MYIYIYICIYILVYKRYIYIYIYLVVLENDGSVLFSYWGKTFCFRFRILSTKQKRNQKTNTKRSPKTKRKRSTVRNKNDRLDESTWPCCDEVSAWLGWPPARCRSPEHVRLDHICCIALTGLS